MTEWFRDAFGEHYLLLYSHRDEQEAAATVDLILRVLQPPPGARVLDAPCGGGRHTKEFNRRGMRATGIDLSRDLLGAALAAQPLHQPQYARADLRALPWPNNLFYVVVNLFSSFGYFSTDEEDALALRQLARVCTPGGFLVMDTMNEHRVCTTLEPLTKRTTPDGWAVTEQRVITGQPPRVEKTITVQSATGESRSLRESVRLYRRDELHSLFDAAGLEITHEFGDYSGARWHADAERLILFGRKR